MTTKLIISGIKGRMGQALVEAIAEAADLALVAGFDMEDGEARLPDGGTVPVYGAASLGKAPVADAVIDFSNHSFTMDLLEWCMEKEVPVVLATTALGDDALALLSEAAKDIPVFRSANMSLGVNLLARLAKQAAAAFGESFDIEIVEKHHNQKKDAPSGTALLLADAAAAGREDAAAQHYCYGRHGSDDPRIPGEIGIHAVRAGTLPGEHTVLFAGPDEVVTLTHTVYSRKVFAHGALAAARFLADKPAGLYSMDDLMG
ncbi:MAG: 4-hydroxy-tetrahydrodipicolinate reductase [Clostridiales Family XIII bacterium]|jgi:4-hydroxy-tetrahydrodipicolinate reductase|nr:4-hydroxy-tetrahydrodipicolinate reductase [Clostridiales Family XIII bacterium]